MGEQERGNNSPSDEPVRENIEPKWVKKADSFFERVLNWGGGIGLIGTVFVAVFSAFHWFVIGVLCCLPVIAGLIAQKTKRTFRTKLAVFLVGIVVSLVIGVSLLPYWPHQSFFSVVAYEKYVELKTPRNLLLWNNGGERTLSPIHVEIFADLIIKTDKKMTVSSYRFEGKTPRNEWVVMPVIDLSFGQLVWLTATNGDLTKRTMQKHVGTNDFYSVLKRRTFAPHEPIPVFIYLEAPTNWVGGEIRLRLKDIEDCEYAETISGPASPKSILENIPISFSLGMSAGTEDLSKLPIVRYSSVILPDNWWNSPN